MIEFESYDNVLDAIADTPNDGDKNFSEWTVDVLNAVCETVARVFKTLYIRKGADGRKRISDRGAA